MRSALPFTLALASLALSSRASAYTDAARFAAPALEGGAGGRFFTGAPADGYACSVCHRGGGTPAIAIDGIPADGWEPNVTYELVLALPAGVRSAGAAMEIADDEGVPQGALALVPEAELDATDRCREGVVATTLSLESTRLIASTNVCGATRARVRWTAPSTPRRGVRVFAAVVAGNDSGDPTGDGASTIALPLRARGAPEASGAVLTQRCSARPGAGESSAAMMMLALVAATLAARRARARP